MPLGVIAEMKGLLIQIARENFARNVKEKVCKTSRIWLPRVELRMVTFDLTVLTVASDVMKGNSSRQD